MYSSSTADRMLPVHPPTYWYLFKKCICFVQGFLRDRTFVSGRDPAGSRYPGIPPDGIRRGIFKHGMVQDGIEWDNLDGIEISRDCTGRD